MVIVLLQIHGKKMPKEKAPCKSLSIIMLDSVSEAKKKYYLQILLEECKYEQERIKIKNLIDDDFKQVNLMNLEVKQNLIMIMMNLMNNLLKVKKIF